ncbi:YggS family pyridoxal phosphate-dependent enzyme [Nocardioides acrostichi]|uniref:YggS family pyridoxal phosphate-dependent enzyme n=1 Tax=Nocardioides acrostichi TaxID=2784339 RepID=UPI002E29BB4C|nr:YggS family pyridoxal phosphate-dependent enzyme [Nocardioides acrostichi]
MSATSAPGREQELRSGLETVRARIERACAESAREPSEVGLVVVTKYFPASDVRLLAGLGVTDVAENRHQEAEAKAAECADLGLRWHFVGGLQSNKATAVAGYADVVESVDRAKLVPRLDRAAAERGHALEILVQVSLDGPDAEHRSGVDPAELLGLADRVAQAEHLELAGIMAVAPLGENPADAFARLREHRELLVSRHPAATRLSAGMSGDLEEAVAAGTTHVRVGSAILGPRPPVH